jgi:hypothetical protein
MICDLPDDILQFIGDQVDDTVSHNALRQVNRSFRNLTECSVYVNKSLKYILEFYLADVIINNPQRIQIGSIKTLFPGYTSIFIKDEGKIITKLYTPRMFSVRTTEIKGSQKTIITKKHNLVTGNHYEQISIQTIDTNIGNPLNPPNRELYFANACVIS